MAATDSKPASLALLKTPLSATYPSELKSPMIQSAAATPTFIKREDSLKTPITPPIAYLDFLKTLSPVLMSPMPTGSSTKFVFEANRPTSIASVTSSNSTTSFTSTSGPMDKPSPTSAPSSRESSCNCDAAKQEPPKTAPLSKPRLPANIDTVSIPPPSPFTRPQSARAPRLYIPQSPYSPNTVRSPALRSPGSATSINSPYSAMSPKPWDLEKKSARSRRVSVREVVTRTVTYSTTPVDPKAPGFSHIDPAPRGKRRKLE
ncbi:hypothetical protein B0J11DRAFT_427902 [Dendryphion nanum]|uniref:Uncharacterized protein n=1 Tax=Dendryphion nanum TaxID=256645 RepID=A0A9P9E5W8_9PLEO|nr:hypothetical protein B0J11DRAFT_427902 [Dendryphion nanum]